MKIQIYNTLKREKEIFEPLEKGKVSMYQCGPTVYNTPQIGNYRAFILYDLIRRVFEYNNYKVNQVMNITDIDDKTIKSSRQENIPLKEFTTKYEKLFLEELESLNILLPNHITRATDYIKEMVELISILIEKEVAYIAKDGIYLSIEKVKDYGKLAQLDLSKINKERIANDEYDKDNPRDFSLWKFVTPEDGDTHYDAPFGSGRPGWHIECSAMAMKILGPTLDIHAGGIDLLFPHHTNEIAQSESATDKTFVNYWIHGAFLTINGERMGKSKGNFLRLKDLLEQSISPLAYRYWLLTAHYRSPVNFTYEAVNGAQNALIRLIKTLGRYPKDGKIIKEYQEKFNDFINDDLNIPQALALTWTLVADHNQSDADKRTTIIDFDRVFGLKLESIPEIEYQDIPPEIQALMDARQDARRQKDWVKADALRDEIINRGYTVEDKS